MSAANRILTGDELLIAVSDAMIAFHQSYHERRPVTGKAALLSEEVLACVLGGVSSEVEKTMIELQDATVLQEKRSPFQDEMQDEFIATVERLSGRPVQVFISNHHTEPEIEIEMFVLKSAPSVRRARRPRSSGGVWGVAYAWERPPGELV
jgi:uncharacterized protein YbcI